MSSAGARAQRRPWVAPSAVAASTSSAMAAAPAQAAAAGTAVSDGSAVRVTPASAAQFTVPPQQLAQPTSPPPAVPYTGLSLMRAARSPPAPVALPPMVVFPASPSAAGAAAAEAASPPLIASPSLTLHFDPASEGSGDSADPIRTPVPVASNASGSASAAAPIDWGSVLLLSGSAQRSSEEPDRSGSGAPLLRLDRRSSLPRSPPLSPSQPLASTAAPTPALLPPPDASASSPSASPRAGLPASPAPSPSAASPGAGARGSVVVAPSPRINKALLSAQAFAKQKSASVLGLVPNSKGSSSGPSLVPGINDSPPQRNRSLGSPSSPRGTGAAGKAATTPKGTPLRSPQTTPQQGKAARSQSVFASLFSSGSGAKDSPKRGAQPAAIAMAPLHSKSRSPPHSAAGDSRSAAEEQKHGSPLAAASASVPASAAVISPLRRVPSAQKIRIVPSAEERGRSELGLEGQPPSPGSPPFKPALRLKQASTRAGGARGRGADGSAALDKRREQLIRDRARDRARAHAWTCDWAAVRASLRKSRKLRPVIGGKFAIRPTFKYLPLNLRRPLFFLHSVLHSMSYQALMLLSVLVALFATDFLYACIPASRGMDAGTGVLLLSLFVVWVTDAAAHVALHSNYSFCIYFWFDALAILSLVVDVSSITGTGMEGGLNRRWSMAHASHSFYALATNPAEGLSFLSQASLFLTTLRILKLCRSVNLLSRKLSKKRYELSESRRCLGQGGSSAASLAADAEHDYFAAGAPDWSYPLSGLHHQHKAGGGGGGGASAFPARRDGSSFSTSLAPPPPSQLGTILSDTISLRGMLLVVALGLAIPLVFVNVFGGIAASSHAARVAGMQRMAHVYSAGLQQLPDRTDTSALDLTMSVLYDNFVATYSADSAAVAASSSSSSGSGSGSSGAEPHRIVAMQWSMRTELLAGVVDTTVASPMHTTLVGPAPPPPPIALSLEDDAASRMASSASSDSVATQTTVLKYPAADESTTVWRDGLELQRVVVHSPRFAWNVTARDGLTQLQADAVYGVYATFDSRSSLVRAAWLHLLFTLCLLCGYLLHTASLVHSTAGLIIHPFERIVGVVWSLTKSLGIVKQEEQYRSKNYGAAADAQDSIILSSSPHGGMLHQQPALSLPSRLYRDARSLFLPCKIRAYELRLVEDMISKLCKIFLLTPASRSMVLTRGDGAGAGGVGGGGGSGTGAGASTAASATATSGSVMAGSPHKFPDASASAGTHASSAGLSSNSSSSALVASRANNHLSKSIRMLTGTRITEIQTPHTILTVHVSERPLDRELKGVKGVPQSQPVCVRNYGDQPRRRNSLSSVTNLNASGFEEFSTMMVSVGPSSNRQSARQRARSEGSLSAASSKASQSALASPGAGAHAHAAEASSNRERDAAASPSNAHASIQSAMQSSIVASALAVGLHTSGPRAMPHRRPTGNKAAQLLGFSGAKLRGAGMGGGGGGGGGGFSGGAGLSSHAAAADHPELASLDTLLLHPLALTHFRAFLRSKLCLEIFLFYIQVLRFQCEVMEKARWICGHFIDVGAAHEVNLPAEIRAEIHSVIDMEGGGGGGGCGGNNIAASAAAGAASASASSSPSGSGSSSGSSSAHALSAASVLLGPSFSMFDRAKAEVVNLLRGSFYEFMNSDQALMHYLSAKMEARVVMRPQMDANGGRGGGAAGGETERF